MALPNDELPVADAGHQTKQVGCAVLCSTVLRCFGLANHSVVLARPLPSDELPAAGQGTRPSRGPARLAAGRLLTTGCTHHAATLLAFDCYALLHRPLGILHPHCCGCPSQLGLQTDGWPMLRWEYVKLMEKARRNALE